MAQEQSVFISYSSRDAEFVKRIIKQLDRMGVSYWKAPEMIPAGSSYAREIPKAIQKCSVFLLVLSPTSQDSPAMVPVSVTTQYQPCLYVVSAL